MIHFWHTLFVAGLVITGIWTLFRKEMLLGNFGEWAYKRLPQMLYKPTIGCPPCMASVHGTWLWFTLGGNIWMWPIFLLALCGLLKLVAIEFLSRA